MKDEKPDLLVAEEMTVFFDRDETPTAVQYAAARVFVATFAMLDNGFGGLGSGRTWFWSRVVRYIRRKEPWLVSGSDRTPDTRELDR